MICKHVPGTDLLTQVLIFLTLNKTTNYMTVQDQLNPFPNKPWFLRVCSTSHLKTLWEKEKLLVTSNFSFSRSVFYLFGELAAIFIKSKIVLCQSFEYGRVKYLSFGKGLSFDFSTSIFDMVL